MKRIDGFDVTAVYSEEEPVTVQYSNEDLQYSSEEEAFDQVQMKVCALYLSKLPYLNLIPTNFSF